MDYVQEHVEAPPDEESTGEPQWEKTLDRHFPGVMEYHSCRWVLSSCVRVIFCGLQTELLLDVSSRTSSSTQHFAWLCLAFSGCLHLPLASQSRGLESVFENELRSVCVPHQPETFRTLNLCTGCIIRSISLHASHASSYVHASYATNYVQIHRSHLNTCQEEVGIAPIMGAGLGHTL